MTPDDFNFCIRKKRIPETHFTAVMAIRDRELGEEFVVEHAGNSNNEADPDRPVPFALHVDLAEPIRKIHR